MRDATASSKVLRFLPCRLWDETYCLNMAWVRGIQRVEQLQPQTDERGLVGWLASEQGKLPVFRLRTLLQRPGEEGRRQGKILILKTHAQSWGLLMDRIENVIEVTTPALLPLPAIVRNPAMDFFEGVVKHEEKMMLALSPEGLYPDVGTGTLSPPPIPYALETLYAVADVRVAPRRRKQIILFNTTPESSLTFALSLSQVPQILRPLPLLPVPGAAASILGLVEWRGVPLPVLDLPRSLGGPASPALADGRLLVARASTTRVCIGVPIHSQVRIHDLPITHHLSSQPVPLHEALLRGTFALPETTLVIPDIDGILGSYYSCPA